MSERSFLLALISLQRLASKIIIFTPSTFSPNLRCLKMRWGTKLPKIYVTQTFDQKMRIKINWLSILTWDSKKYHFKRTAASDKILLLFLNWIFKFVFFCEKIVQQFFLWFFKKYGFTINSKSVGKNYILMQIHKICKFYKILFISFQLKLK